MRYSTQLIIIHVVFLQKYEQRPVTEHTQSMLKKSTGFEAFVDCQSLTTVHWMPIMNQLSNWKADYGCEVWFAVSTVRYAFAVSEHYSEPLSLVPANSHSTRNAGMAE